MIHIVFNELDVKILESAIDLDETLQGNIVQIKDDYSVGPVHNIYEEQGIQDRKDWWKLVVQGGDFESKITGIDDNLKIKELTTILDSNDTECIWIWAAQNKRDVSGYYWLLHFLKPYQGRVFILYLNNLPFINEKGNIFYPNALHEIPAKEFLKAKKLSREITLSEFEVDPDEWNKLCNENKGIRILEGGKKLAQKDFDFYDSELKKYIMPDWQKASKIIHNCITKSLSTISEEYLLWRLKTFLEMNLYDVQGKISNMKDFDIKYFSKAD
jgi:hypothetical protein